MTIHVKKLNEPTTYFVSLQTFFDAQSDLFYNSAPIFHMNVFTREVRYLLEN